MLLVAITDTTILSRLTCVARGAVAITLWLTGPAVNCEKTVDEVQLGVRMPNLDVNIGLIAIYRTFGTANKTSKSPSEG